MLAAISLVVAPSAYLVPFVPTTARATRACVRLDEAAVAATAPEEEASVTTEDVVAAAVEEEAAPAPPSVEDEIRALASSNAIEFLSSEAVSKLKEIEKDFNVPDAAALKEQLHGSWQLLSASDAFSGMTGSAQETWQKPLGHVQTFRKPDPMDLFSGDKDKLFFMETTEVVGCAQFGATSTATIKGGFSISDDLGVVESYTKKVLDGMTIFEEGMALNVWEPVYVSESVRVARTKSGDYRVYEKVEPSVAAESIKFYAATKIDIDPDAGPQVTEEEEEEEYDDPNIPEWQKRIDKLDGTKRTKNGTPIINHGTDRFGGGGSQTR